MRDFFRSEYGRLVTGMALGSALGLSGMFAILVTTPHGGMSGDPSLVRAVAAYSVFSVGHFGGMIISALWAVRKR